METMQAQINTLNGKIDSLHHLVDQMGTSLAQVIAEVKFASTPGMGRSSNGMGRSGYSYHSDPSMEHKDVLVDNTNPEATGHSGERALSPEVQIQRLTAQLTAAYNRIAALEEQLLAQRIH